MFDRQDAVERISLGVVTVGSLAYNTGFLRALLDQGKEAAFSMKFDPHAFPEPQLREFLQSSAYIFMNESEAANICRLLGWQGVEQLFQTGRQKDVYKRQIPGRRSKNMTSAPRAGTCPPPRCPAATSRRSSWRGRWSGIPR